MYIVCLLIVGPGLSIRVICAEEPYMCKDFAETSVLLKFLLDFSNSVKTVSAWILLLICSKCVYTMYVLNLNVYILRMY